MLNNEINSANLDETKRDPVCMEEGVAHSWLMMMAARASMHQQRTQRVDERAATPNGGMMRAKPFD